MNTFVLQSTLEILLGAFFIWGLFNEDVLAKLEKRFLKSIKNKMAKVRN